MVNFWKLSYEAVKKQRDQYKTENKELKESFQYQLEKRLEYFKKYQELKQENEKLSKLKEIKENALKGANYIIENQKAKIKRLEEENEEYRKESEQLKIKNEYLLNVIKMSENIEIHSDAYDEMEKGESNKTHHIPHLTDIKTNENIEEPMKFIKRIAKERADDER